MLLTGGVSTGGLGGGIGTLASALLKGLGGGGGGLFGGNSQKQAQAQQQSQSQSLNNTNSNEFNPSINIEFPNEGPSNALGSLGALSPINWAGMQSMAGLPGMQAPELRGYQPPAMSPVPTAASIFPSLPGPTTSPPGGGSLPGSGVGPGQGAPAMLPGAMPGAGGELGGGGDIGQILSMMLGRGAAGPATPQGLPPGPMMAAGRPSAAGGVVSDAGGPVAAPQRPGAAARSSNGNGIVPAPPEGAGLFPSLAPVGSPAPVKVPTATKPEILQGNAEIARELQEGIVAVTNQVNGRLQHIEGTLGYQRLVADQRLKTMESNVAQRIVELRQGAGLAPYQRGNQLGADKRNGISDGAPNEDLEDIRRIERRDAETTKYALSQMSPVERARMRMASDTGMGATVMRGLDNMFFGGGMIMRPGQKAYAKAGAIRSTTDDKMQELDRDRRAAQLAKEKEIDELVGKELSNARILKNNADRAYFNERKNAFQAGFQALDAVRDYAKFADMSRHRDINQQLMQQQFAWKQQVDAANIQLRANAEEFAEANADTARGNMYANQYRSQVYGENSEALRPFIQDSMQAKSAANYGMLMGTMQPPEAVTQTAAGKVGEILGTGAGGGGGGGIPKTLDDFKKWAQSNNLTPAQAEQVRKGYAAAGLVNY